MQASIVEYKEELTSVERMSEELKNSGQPWMPDELLKGMWLRTNSKLAEKKSKKQPEI